MTTKIKKWTYKPFKKVIMPYEKVLKYKAKNKCVIYDTRTMFEFNLGKIKGSKHVSILSIKKQLRKHNKWDRIILISNYERGNAALASWTRAELKLKRVYVLAGGIKSLKPSQLVKKRVSKKKK